MFRSLRTLCWLAVGLQNWNVKRDSFLVNYSNHRRKIWGRGWWRGDSKGDMTFDLVSVKLCRWLVFLKLIMKSMLILQCKAVLPVWWPLAIGSYWALEMWPKWEIFLKCKMYTWFLRCSTYTRKNHIDYMLQW